MPITPTPHVWMNGELVPWDEATIHVATHSLHYGTGIYEGVRAYETDRGPGLFRLTEHIERFYRSAQILGMPIGYSVPEIVEACKLTVRDTGLDSCYVRPLAYYGYGHMGLDTGPCEVDIAIVCWPWASVRGADSIQKGLKLKVSSWRRHDHNVMPPMSKTTGGYVNASLAKAEAHRAGYDDCVLLNTQGLVAECTAENIFIVRNGKILTPPHSAAALEGLTQQTVRVMAEDLGYEIEVCELSRSDLYVAEEMFVCGTASEITSVKSVDDREIPFPGPIGAEIAALYSDIVHGRRDEYLHWVEIP